MITIKDIAKTAGVSQGTVSNVLNNRGNVSSGKIRRVLDACKELGYVPNHQAKYLRESASRLLGVMLPNLEERRYIDFYLSFKAYADSHGYTVRQYLPAHSDDAEAEEAERQTILQDGVRGIAVFGGNGQIADAAFAQGIAALYVEHRPDPDAAYIGFDYERAGRDIAMEVCRKGHKRIVLFTGYVRASNNRDFCRGFFSALGGGGAQVVHVQTDKQGEPSNVLGCTALKDADAVVCSRLELLRVVQNLLRAFSTKALPALYTLSPLFTLPQPDFIKYELNYRLLGNAAARELIRSIEGKETPRETILANTGFRAWSPRPLEKPAVHALNVIALDSPGAYNLREMAHLYTRETGVNVNVTIYSYDELYEILGNMRKNAAFDVIRMDVTWLSFFAKRILMPLEQIDSGVREDFNGFLEGAREPYSTFDGVLYALPSSPSAQMLFYRSDLFSNAMCRRMFQERYGVELAVPKTFDEYNRIAAFFTRALNPDSPVRYGSTLTLGSTAVACSEYLARLFALQPHLYGEDGRVDLRAEKSVRALEQLLEIRPYTDPEYCVWWRNTANVFAKGDTAMAILYNHYASPLVGHESKIREHIGYAMIPGGNPLLGGGCIGVSRFTLQPELALNFIRWFCSEPVSSASTFLGSVSPCTASYDNYEIINTYPWLRAVPSCFDAARGRRTPPNLTMPFDERRLMSIVGMAVRNVYSGVHTPQQAMEYAQALFAEQFPELAGK